MDEYNPKSLPSIDAVQIVDIRNINPSDVSQYMQVADDAQTVHCDDKSAQEIANTWRELTPGESSRCHIPPIGSRFLVGETAFLQASVCWECDNIFGIQEGHSVFYAFDSESIPAKRLFRIARRIMGADVLGDG